MKDQHQQNPKPRTKRVKRVKKDRYPELSQKIDKIINDCRQRMTEMERKVYVNSNRSFEYEYNSIYQYNQTSLETLVNEVREELSSIVQVEWLKCTKLLSLLERSSLEVSEETIKYNNTCERYSICNGEDFDPTTHPRIKPIYEHLCDLKEENDINEIDYDHQLRRFSRIFKELEEILKPLKDELTSYEINTPDLQDPRTSQGSQGNQCL